MACGDKADDTGPRNDRDGDGYSVPLDCDDDDASIHPEAEEIWYDGVDQDCDGNDDDQDEDGVPIAEDCNDQDPDVHPGADETWYDGVDQDCDEADDYDADCDGYRGPSESGPDCDDSDPTIHPDAEEVCNGVDDDCDGTADGESAIDAGLWYHDADGDGVGGPFAGVRSCEQPGGHVSLSGDCDDDDPEEYPGVVREFAGYAMTCIGAGGFPYGSPEDEVGRYSENEETQSELILEQAFYIGIREVTLSQFVSVAGLDPDPHPDCDDDCAVPVEHEPAEYFANQLSIAAGLQECYTCSLDSDGYPYWCTSNHEDPRDCAGFRLPSNEEWEKAARAGISSAFSNGGNLHDGDEYSCEADIILDNGSSLDDIAHYCGSEEDAPLAPGTRAPNPWGLHDIHGNLGEWIEGSYYDVTDHRYYGYCRGGYGLQHNQYPSYLRSAAQGTSLPYDTMGVRLVQTANH
jgi:formylglycine-generating enzyme required for sulfatase activity